MGTLRGASAQRGSLVVDCAVATSAIAQTSPANTVRQISPLPAPQINTGSVLNASTGVFTPAISGRYRISGMLAAQTNLGISSVYLYLFQGSTSLRNLAAALNIPSNGIPILSFSQVINLAGGTAYNLRFFSTIDNLITEMQLSIEYVSP